ncbi:FAD:protein FMN transferase [Mucilaginibacter kameinonensis]|uniref:FAD:protein FMN transferase n=1 Tax=Mucilaginibacter kameinonensis TaxID=452286 RepID=UPI000EF85162|nr:FAD:protein FMN transferase [Mucilaginibacter kameinonensis]
MHKEQLVKQECQLMGNRFQLSVVTDDTIWANNCISAGIEEIRRIERLLTTFNDDSETARVNEAAGIAPVQVSRETFELIRRSIRISSITQGAFDITYGSMDKRLWNFDQGLTSLPNRQTAAQMVRLINYRNIVLDENNSTVFLKEKGMRIGFGGIGKGYAADRAKAVMQQMGVQSGVVNASGDLSAWGTQANGRPWTVGIANPDWSSEVFSYLEMSNLAVATSGNYEKFAIIDGKRYSHTINPRTGLPVTGIKSVTIITAHAELADAMATPVMVMGVSAGLNLINQLQDMEAIIIDDYNCIYTSHNIHLN